MLKIKQDQKETIFNTIAKISAEVFKTDLGDSKIPQDNPNADYIIGIDVELIPKPFGGRSLKADYTFDNSEKSVRIHNFSLESKTLEVLNNTDLSSLVSNAMYNLNMVYGMRDNLNKFLTDNPKEKSMWSNATIGINITVKNPIDEPLSAGSSGSSGTSGISSTSGSSGIVEIPKTEVAPKIGDTQLTKEPKGTSGSSEPKGTGTQGSSGSNGTSNAGTQGSSGNVPSSADTNKQNEVDKEEPKPEENKTKDEKNKETSCEVLKGLLFYNKKSYLQIDNNKHVYMIHAGDVSKITLIDGVITIESTDKIHDKSPYVYIEGDKVDVGKGADSPATRCKELMQMLQGLVSIIDAKVPTNPAASNLLSSMSSGICSKIVQIAP